MIFPDDFIITDKWAPQDPARLQLYSFPTPNGIKVSAALEELGLPYDAHLVNFLEGEQMTPEFLSVAPNNKIPAIVDPDGPGGQPLSLFESGAILLYLADKTGNLISADPVERQQTIQWVMWQMGGAGPMFGQFGFFFKLGGKDWEDKRPMERYRDETMRLLGVLDKHLEGRTYMVGEAYSIADIAIWPWINTLRGFYEAGDALEMSSFANVVRWADLCSERPASKAAINIPPRP